MRKKEISRKITLLMIMVLIIALPVMCYAGINININGSPVVFTASSGAPFIDASSRTQVPLRVAMESYGCEVSWNQATQTATVEKDGTIVDVPIGANYILKNGAKITNDTAALIKDGRTYLPIRAVLEAFGANVSWDQTTQTVIVSASDGTQIMTVHFIDVGQGDSILIDYGTNECLIDAGTASSGKVVSNYIKNYVDGDIELVIGSHAHADHVGGLTQIISDYTIDKIIDSGSMATSQSWKNYYAAATAEVGSNFITDADMDLGFGENASIKIIEGLDNDSNENNNSVTSLVTYNNVKILLTGDNEVEGENAIINKVSNVDVFKAGHHGSRTANSSAILNKIKPEYVIISAGVGNTYAHPHTEALQKFKNVGATVYGTFKSGSIVMSTNGNTYSFNTSNEVTLDDAGDKSETIITEITKTLVSEQDVEPGTYIGNKNSHIFHKASCTSVSKMSESNKVSFATPEKAVMQGYTPCKICNP